MDNIFLAARPGRFIEFADDPAYGGSQGWFLEAGGPLNANRNKTGCGSVAAANVIAYMAGRRGCEALPAPGTKAEFVSLMTELYDGYTRQSLRLPGSAQGAVPTFGVWSAAEVTAGIVGFCGELGVTLTAWAVNSRRPLSAACEFISEALAQDYPVIMLVRFNSYAQSLKKPGIMSQLHFVTVTGINFNGGNPFVTVSNWGRRVEIDLRQLWHSAGAFNFALASVSLAYVAVG